MDFMCTVVQMVRFLIAESANVDWVDVWDGSAIHKSYCKGKW